MIQLKTKIFLITFFAYMMAHSLRTTWSFSKSSLSKKSPGISILKSDLAITDVIFMVCYSIGFTFLGPIGERVSKKKFLILGYLLCSISFCVFPLIYQFSGTKNVAVLMVFMTFNGVGQSVGLPGSLSLLSLYYDKSKRGFHTSFWIICTNLGNILGFIGSTIIVNYLHEAWYTAYYVFCGLLFFMLIIIFIFLDENQVPIEPISQQQDQIQVVEGTQQMEVTYFSAFCLPRVIQYCIALSCVKGAIYGLLFWLPKYLQQRGMGVQSGYISSIQQVGSIFGGMLMGYLGDKYIISFFLTPSLYISTLLLLVPRFLLGNTALPYYFVMFFLGIFLGGVYNVITSSICIDLGTQKSIQGNKKAISTITGVIDGVAAMFTAATQLILGYTSQNIIFILMAIYCILAAICLTPILYRDIKYYSSKKNQQKQQNIK